MFMTPLAGGCSFHMSWVKNVFILLSNTSKMDSPQHSLSFVNRSPSWALTICCKENSDSLSTLSTRDKDLAVVTWVVTQHPYSLLVIVGKALRDKPNNGCKTNKNYCYRETISFVKNKTLIELWTSFVPSLVMVDKICRELYCVSSFFILFSSFSPSGTKEKEAKLLISRSAHSKETVIVAKLCTKVNTLHIHNKSKYKAATYGVYFSKNYKLRYL